MAYFMGGISTVCWSWGAIARIVFAPSKRYGTLTQDLAKLIAFPRLPVPSHWLRGGIHPLGYTFPEKKRHVFKSDI
jgi:hypothetical protein